jgi:hypothetical protein
MGFWPEHGRRAPQETSGEEQHRETGRTGGSEPPENLNFFTELPTAQLLHAPGSPEAFDSGGFRCESNEIRVYATSRAAEDSFPPSLFSAVFRFLEKRERGCGGSVGNANRSFSISSVRRGLKSDGALK